MIDAGQSPALRLLMAADVDPFHVIGGAERMLNNYAVRLAQRGHSVTVLCRRERDDLPAEECREGVRVVRHPVSRGGEVRFVRSVLRYGRETAERLLSEQPFDLLNVHQPLAAAGVFQTAASRSVPAVYTYLSPWCLEYSTRKAARIRERLGAFAGLAEPWLRLNSVLRRRIEGRALRRADGIVVLSEFTGTQLHDLHGIGPDRWEQIPGGVDTARFRPAEDRMRLRRSLGLPDTGPLLLTVRNLVPRMGLDTLVSAFVEVCSSLPGAVLCIGGEGELRESLERQAFASGAGDRIRFLGFIPEERLPDYYGAADLFVLPTRALEGFGLVTVEALACGTPVLGTPVGATAEILGALERTDGVGPGLLLADAGAPAMARALLAQVPRLTGNEGLRGRCRDFAEQRYCWEAVIARVEGLFSEVASRNRRRVGGVSS